MLDLARAKLVDSREINSTLNNFSRLAVLDVQLSLDFEPRREKVQIEEATSRRGCCPATLDVEESKSICGGRDAHRPLRNWLA